MAMMDYGAIAFKNGELISTEFFTPMIDMVGWEDTENDVYHDYHADEDKPLNLNGNYFAYVGDTDCTLAFYKCQIDVNYKYSNGTYGHHHEWFNSTNYVGWRKWEYHIGWFGDVNYGAPVVTKRNGYYVCKWKYKGDKYKVYFGYGVDLDCYKKYRIVNYYRTPKFRLMDIKDWFEYRYLKIKRRLEMKLGRQKTGIKGVKMFNTYNQTYKPTNSAYNSLNINAVSGMLVKNHPKSFMVQCQFGSKMFDRLFNTENPYWIVHTDGHCFNPYSKERKNKGSDWHYEDKDVVVLQALLCGDNRVMCEIVFKEDWDDPMTCGNA